MSYSRSLIRAFRAVEQAMGSPAPRTRKKPTRPSPKLVRKPKRAGKPAQAAVPVAMKSTGARVVSRGAGHRRTSKAYNPPRSEPDVTALVETFAPSLPPPAKLPEAVQASLDEGLIDEHDAAALAEVYAQGGRGWSGVAPHQQTKSKPTASGKAGPAPRPQPPARRLEDYGPFDFGRKA